jgi:tyrosyl-tRNA synthetase
MNQKNKQDLQLLQEGIADCLPAKELDKKLQSGKKLRIKLGMDPTSPDLHLGHAVVLRKMKQFQDLGHEVIFLIGDYTAQIGDPSGKSKTRPALSAEEIVENAKTYFDQVKKVLDPDKVTVAYNSSWLSKLTFADTIKLCSKVTVARLLERDDFSNRMKKQQPIAMHELLYPIMQGYDSVALQADVELGGTDQTFNLLCGRFLQEQYEQQAQVVMTMPLLEGLDGVEKMSKSLGNAVGLTEEPSQAYGKLMSISDDLMWRYYHLLLYVSMADIEIMKQNVMSSKVHPMDLKKKMAHDIIASFWSAKQAEQAQQQFEAVFQQKDYSQAKQVSLPDGHDNPMWIVTLLKTIGAIQSSSEAKRLIQAKSVSIDDMIIDDFKAEITISQGMTLKVGKHRIYVFP